MAHLIICLLWLSPNDIVVSVYVVNDVAGNPVSSPVNWHFFAEINQQWLVLKFSFLLISGDDYIVIILLSQNPDKRLT